MRIWLYCIIYGIIQGITEWLPISSTGHLILFEKFVSFQFSDTFLETFRVFVHFGSVFAVFSLYFKKIYPFGKNKDVKEKKKIFFLWKKVILAVIPAGVIGFLFDDWFTENFYNYFTVSVTLIVYGVLFVFFERIKKGENQKITDLNDIPFSTAFLIGAFQALAIIPGTSRSGATILGAMLLGCSRTVSAEFSFFLATPVIFGASFLKLFKYGLFFSSEELIVLSVGALVSFIFAKLSVGFLVSYVKKHGFALFGYYRIALGIFVLIIFSFYK